MKGVVYGSLKSIERGVMHNIQFDQIVAFDIGDVDQVYGLDKNGHVWYYCWREEAWFPLKMRKGRERSDGNAAVEGISS